MLRFTMMTIIMLTLGSAVPGAPSRETPLKALAFMSGCWRGSSAPGVAVEEFYTAPVPNLMLGTTRYLRDGYAVQFEFSKITPDSTGIFLLPYPGGQPSEHPFRLIQVDSASAMFEAPEHDFPRRIHYAVDDEGRLTARIDDGTDGRVLTWRMDRVACPSSSSGAPAP